jgi:hypothetical protein
MAYIPLKLTDALAPREVAYELVLRYSDELPVKLHVPEYFITGFRSSMVSMSLIDEGLACSW